MNASMYNLCHIKTVMLIKTMKVKTILIDMILDKYNNLGYKLVSGRKIFTFNVVSCVIYVLH